MKNIKIQTLVFLSICIHCSLFAVKMRLPYPSALKKSFNNLEEQDIFLRESKEDMQTVSSECPLSKVSFDDLFDDAITNKIIIGGIVTEVNNTLVSHHFDGAVLMDYVIQLLPEKTTLLKFIDGISHEYTFKNAYKNVIDTTDTRVHLFNSSNMTDNEKEWCQPIFIDPINRQIILTLQFFTVCRRVYEDRRYDTKDVRYEYDACFLGDMNQILLHGSTVTYFEKCLLKNMFWRDKLDLSIKQIGGTPLSQSNYRAREQDYVVVKNILDVKKDEITQDQQLNDDMQNRLETVAELFADFFDTSHNYVKALEYYEKELRLQSFSALLRAATIRLGYMQQASREEQLKGLELYEKILDSCNSTRDRGRHAYELAQLLYERAQTHEDYAQAGSYIKNFVESDDACNDMWLRESWLRSNVLMAKIYFSQEDYETAEYYLKRVKYEKSLSDICCDVKNMLLSIAWVKNTKSLSSLVESYQRLYNAPSTRGFRLKGCIAQNIAILLYTQSEQEGFQKSTGVEIEKYLQLSKSHYVKFLERYLALNDYEQDALRKNIQEVDAKLVSLQEALQKPKSEEVVKAVVVKKRFFEGQGDKRFKRAKE
jgi:hypothetical protein